MLSISRTNAKFNIQSNYDVTYHRKPPTQNIKVLNPLNINSNRYRCLNRTPQSAEINIASSQVKSEFNAFYGKVKSLDKSNNFAKPLDQLLSLPDFELRSLSFRFRFGRNAQTSSLLTRRRIGSSSALNIPSHFIS